MGKRFGYKNCDKFFCCKLSETKVSYSTVKPSLHCACPHTTASASLHRGFFLVFPSLSLYSNHTLNKYQQYLNTKNCSYLTWGWITCSKTFIFMMWQYPFTWTTWIYNIHIKTVVVVVVFVVVNSQASIQSLLSRTLSLHEALKTSLGRFCICLSSFGTSGSSKGENT